MQNLLNMDYEAQHWSTILPIHCLKRLPLHLYRNICNAVLLNDTVKSILQNVNECKEEKKLHASLTRIEGMIKESMLRDPSSKTPLSLLDYLVNQCGKSFCKHDQFFLERYYSNLIEHNHVDIYKDIIKGFDSLYKSSMRGVYGERIEFPLPPNYIPRIGLLRTVQNALRQNVSSGFGLFQSGCSKCIVIIGNSRCGKTAVVANILRDVELRGTFTSITAIKFGDEEDIDSLMDEVVDDAKNRKISQIDPHLLVLDNLSETGKRNWNVKHIEMLGQYYKCMIITTRESDWEIKSKQCKFTVINAETGLDNAESVSLFCSMFKCTSDQIAVPLLNVVNQIYGYCKGCPLRQRIIYTLAWKTQRLSCQAQDFLKWHAFFKSILESRTDNGNFGQNQTIKTEAVPEKERTLSPDTEDTEWTLESDSASESEYEIISNDEPVNVNVMRSISVPCGIGARKEPPKVCPPTKPLTKKSVSKSTPIILQKKEHSVLLGSSEKLPVVQVHGSFRYSLTEKYLLNTAYGRSKIYVGHCTERKQQVAIKKIVPEKFDEEVEQVKLEYNTVVQLNHDNLLRYYDLVVQPKECVILLFMEYCTGGCLKKVVERGAPPPAIKSYLKQILDGVKYLHNQQIFHLDLKCENILLDKNDQIKIGDFGEMIAWDISQNFEDIGVRGTGLYMSPEMISGGDIAEIGRPSDIWSFGCVALELLTRQAPKYQKTDGQGRIIPLEGVIQILYYVANAKNGKPYIPGDLDKVAFDFLMYCFKRDYAYRPSAEQLLTHQFLLETKECEVIKVEKR